MTVMDIENKYEVQIKCHQMSLRFSWNNIVIEYAYQI